MRKCNFCGEQVDEKLTVCPFCGKKPDATVTRCPRCGSVTDAAEPVCQICAEPLSTSGHTPTSVIPSETLSSEDSPEKSQMPLIEPKRSGKKIWLICLPILFCYGLIASIIWLYMGDGSLYDRLFHRGEADVDSTLTVEDSMQVVDDVSTFSQDGWYGDVPSPARLINAFFDYDDVRMAQLGKELIERGYRKDDVLYYTKPGVCTILFLGGSGASSIEVKIADASIRSKFFSAGKDAIEGKSDCSIEIQEDTEILLTQDFDKTYIFNGYLGSSEIRMEILFNFVEGDFIGKYCYMSDLKEFGNQKSIWKQINGTYNSENEELGFSACNYGESKPFAHFKGMWGETSLGEGIHGEFTVLSTNESVDLHVYGSQ